MLFVVMPNEDAHGGPGITIVRQCPAEGTPVWSTRFASWADRDLVYDEMRLRRGRWCAWGNLAMFAGVEALNDQLLRELSLPV